MDIFSFIEQAFGQYGYVIVFFGAFFESLIGIGLILPGSFIVLFGGYFARMELINVYLIGFLAFFGMFLGDLTNYALGKTSFSKYLLKHPRLSGIFNKESQARKQIEKYGMLAIFYSHILGYTRSVICFSAGLIDFPFRQFIITAFIASSFWGILFVGLGYFLGTTTEGLKDLSTRVTIAAWLVLLAFITLKLLQNFILSSVMKKK
ncbi:DedA family protein [Candidatus Gottesmanbacteria bacterium]|nr:DedA family protein [Candidatus Gottesmanbacteria bacterium]